MRVTYFQRKPRKGFSFSLEYIFSDIRQRLHDRIESDLKICMCYNDGYFTKLINIIQAGLRQSSNINHITGEVHFLNFLMKKKNVVLTILDCGMMERKTGYKRRVIKALYLSIPVRKASHVTTISQLTKNEIIQHTRCNPNKVTVIPVSVDPIFKPSPKPFNEECPNILQIGVAENKNVLRLVQALEGINCTLTIVGKLQDAEIQELHRRKVRYNSEYNVSKDRLAELYRQCDILSFVSTREGFGMPIIEANCVERVVLTSNVSSMPEVAGGSGFLVDPFDSNAIRKGVQILIENPELRRSLISLGRSNRSNYEGDAIAGKYYEIYTKMTANQLEYDENN